MRVVCEVSGGLHSKLVFYAARPVSKPAEVTEVSDHIANAYVHISQIRLIYVE